MLQQTIDLGSYKDTKTFRIEGWQCTICWPDAERCKSKDLEKMIDGKNWLKAEFTESVVDEDDIGYRRIGDKTKWVEI